VKESEVHTTKTISMKKLLILLFASFLICPTTSFAQDRKHKTTASAKVGKAGQSQSRQTEKPTTRKTKKKKTRANKPEKRTVKKKTSGSIKV
jgi:hypothetical protein